MSSSEVDIGGNPTQDDCNCSPLPEEDQSETTDSIYPPQRHAGAVGYGPEYGKGVSTSDKLEGLKEEIEGTIFRNPELVQHGYDLRTGELKRRKSEADLAYDPFAWQHAQESENGDQGEDRGKARGKSQAKDLSRENKGQLRKVATTAFEGMDRADQQKRGQTTKKADSIGDN